MDGYDLAAAARERRPDLKVLEGARVVQLAEDEAPFQTRWTA